MHRRALALLACVFCLTPIAFMQSEPAVDAIAVVAMCDEREPGEKLELYGQVRDEDGRPLSKASVIAYSTDATGLYVPRGSKTRTPRIRGVAITDADGWYRFRTIRPGGYPGTDDPQHIHLHIDAAVHRQTMRDVWFEDDPRVTPGKRRAMNADTAILSLKRRADRVWVGRYDVRLAGS